MAKSIGIYDTTLRDSELLPGFRLTEKEKVEIAKQLERLGVDAVDVGTGSDAKAVAAALIAPIAVISVRPEAASIDEAASLLGGCEKRRINIRLSSQEITDNETERLLIKAKNSFSRLEITIDCEAVLDDELRNSACELAAVVEADIVCVCDTLGYSTPSEFSSAVESLREQLSDEISIAVDCRNDLGMAVANSLSAIKAGASVVECSLNGVGKRAGNAPLEEIVMGMEARKDYYDAKTNVIPRQIYRTGKLVSIITGFAISANKPIVGDNALNVDMYDKSSQKVLITPEDVGIFRGNYVLGNHSSLKNFEERVSELGYFLTKSMISEAYNKFKKIAERKKTVSDRDIEAIVEPLGAAVGQKYELVNFVINSGSLIPSTATIIMKTDDGERIKVATGTGPVDASFKAIDKIFSIPVKLEDFSLQSVTEGEDALGDANVKIRYGERLFTGKGVSTDIVEAGIRAYINALNKIAATLAE